MWRIILIASCILYGVMDLEATPTIWKNFKLGYNSGSYPSLKRVIDGYISALNELKRYKGHQGNKEYNDYEDYNGYEDYNEYDSYGDNENSYDDYDYYHKRYNGYDGDDYNGPQRLHRFKIRKMAL